MEVLLRKRIMKFFSYIKSVILKYKKRNVQSLRMRRKNLDFLEELAVPSGYQIRTYRRGDEESWVRIIESSFGHGYDAWHPNINEIVNDKEFDPNSLFFVTYQNNPIGTACALRRSPNGQNVGYVHMVAVTPEHQGKKLGRLLVLCTLHYFKEKGFHEVVLNTEDHRLPGIKTYLDLEFEPVYLGSDHRRRWEAIFENLNKFNKRKSHAGNLTF